jgi:hypothetical protein
MTTIFMVYPPLSKPQAQRLVQFVKRRQGLNGVAIDQVAGEPYFRSGMVSGLSLESTTTTANRLAGSRSLAFSLTL